jgi:hypothetical protein
VLPREKCTSRSYTGRATSKLVPVVLSAGVKFSGEPSEQYTKVLAAATAGASASSSAPTDAAAVAGAAWRKAGGRGMGVLLLGRTQC